MGLSELRPQYHFRKVGAQTHIWDVRQLLMEAADLPIVHIPLADIRELDETYWYDDAANVPTCRAVADHMAQVQAADLSYPILLCAEGRVMDGMHRVVKAYLANHVTIAARQLRVTPPPDHIDVPADQLSY